MKQYDNLLKNFKEISRKKWIKSVNHNHGGVGVTFEQELNKKSDALFFPDYEGIELKCTTRYSNYPLYLFTLAFDGPTFPEIERLVDLYGYPDADFLDKKVLFTKLSVRQSYVVNMKYKFKLELNKEKDKLYLKVLDIDNNLIEMKSFVYLKSIYDHLMIKLNKLAIIKAYKKKIKGEDYFRYYRISIYELYSFDKFIDLLESGYIIVDLVARLNKSGVDKGRYRNKNLVFSIRKTDVDKLFNMVYEYDADEWEKELSSGFHIMP